MEAMVAASTIEKVGSCSYMKAGGVLLRTTPSIVCTMVFSGYSMCLARAVGVVGLLFSCLTLAPHIVSYYVDLEWSVVQPAVKLMQEMLENEHQKQLISKLILENQSFQEGFSRNIETAVVAIAVLGSMNICMNVSMLIGSCCNVRLLFKALMSSNYKYVSK